MRLLHFVHGYFPRHRGGTETYVAALVRAQIERGHELAVATGTEEESPTASFECSREQGHQVYRLRRSGLFLDSWQSTLDPEAEDVLIEIARDFQPDLVHVHHWRRLGLGLVRRLRAEGIKVVLTLHDLSSTCARYFRVRDESLCERPPVPASCRDCVERFWFQDDAEVDARVDLWRQEMTAELAAADLLLAPSESLADMVADQLAEELPGLRERIVVRQLGFDVDVRRVRPEGEKLKLAYWGALHAMKGPQLLLQALKRLKRDDYELDLWGDLDAIDPIFRDRLEGLMDGLPVNKRGKFRSSEIPASYDLAIFPSIALESHSFTVDEAFARGIPVLVPDRGAPMERLKGGGLTFQAENVRDLSLRIADVLNNPGRLEEMRSAVQRPLSMAEHAADLAELYRRAYDEEPARFYINTQDRLLLYQNILRNRDTELWRLRGRVDQEATRADALDLEVTSRDSEIDRRDEILKEYNKNLSDVTEALRERDGQIVSLNKDIQHLQTEFQNTLKSRDLDALRRDTTIEDFSRSASALRSRLDQVEGERNELATQLQELTARHNSETETAQASLQHLEAGLEAERRRRLEAEQGLEIGALAREELAVEIENLRSLREEAIQAMEETQAAALAERSVLLEQNAKLESQRDQLKSDLERLGEKSAEIVQTRERLRLISSNLRNDLDAERERLTLTSAALDRALVEIEGLQDERRRLLERMLESLRPSAIECGVHDVENRPAEELVDLAAKNHGRLHGLIQQRDQLLQEMVMRIDDYERRLGPPALDRSSGPAAEPASSLRRKIRGLTRRARRKTSERMRILLVVHDFLPKHNAGTEIYTYNLAKELAARHDVHLLFCEARHELPRYSVSHGHFDGLPYTEVVHNYQWESFEETYHDPRMEAIFSEVLDDFEPDLVHIQHLHYFSMKFIDIAKVRGLPVAYTLHEFMLICARGGQLMREDMELCEGPVPEKCADCIRHQKLADDYGQDKNRRAQERVAELLPETLQRAFEGFAGPRHLSALDDESRQVYARAAAARLKFVKASADKVDLFISPSAFLREKFIAAGMARPDQIIHSDNGFDLRPFKDFAKKPSKVLRFGFVGTIAEYKGIHVMVEAMNGIRDAGVELQIWGDIETFADYKAELLPLIQNPAIKLMGRFDNNRIAEVLAGIDVLIVPSLWFENSPLTIHEAWLARIPVLASDRGGMAELVDDGVNGFHFRLGDAADLRAKMRRFIADRSLIESMGQKPGVVKPIAENAREIEAHYRDLLGSLVK